MIEVEKKFLLDDSSRQRLLAGAEFLGEVINHDTYFDTTDYSLTKKNYWLRQRNNKFELKMALRGEKAKSTNTTLYNEITDEKEIRQLLSIPKTKNLAEDLIMRGYKPFASWTNTRKKYKKDGFIIDVDSVDFGHEVVEIEMMVNTKSETQNAVKLILGFAGRQGLNLAPVLGKVPEYLKRHNSAHFRALIQAGVIQKTN